MRLKTAALALLFLFITPVLAFGVSPSPELLARMESDPALAAQVDSALASARARGVDQPVEPKLTLVPDRYGIPRYSVTGGPVTIGEARTLAILVDFKDISGHTFSSRFDDLVFGDVYGPSSLRGYLREVSYGTPTTRGLLDIVPVAGQSPSDIGWVTLSQTTTYYAGVKEEGVEYPYGHEYPWGMGEYPNNAQKLVEDAIAAIDPFVDFSEYDNDGDGWVENLIVVHAGAGAETSGLANTIWSHAWVTSDTPTVDGKKIGRYSISPEYNYTWGDITVGTMAHEFGHTMNLVDLYDRDMTSAGIGRWSLMASGSWNSVVRAGDSPARLDPWSSARLGWVQPQQIDGAAEMRDVPRAGTARSGDTFKMYPRGDDSWKEYYLVENRQRSGTDAALPGDGILVWHVDEQQLVPLYDPSKEETVAPLNDFEERKLVDLEEAHGEPQSLDRGTNHGDAGDPFPGTSNNRTFRDYTDPSAFTNDLFESRVIVDMIGSSDATMTARIGIDVGEMAINRDAVYTDGPSVTIDSRVFHAYEMRVDIGEGFGPWIRYREAYPVTFSIIDGEARATVEYRDAGLMKISTLTDTILIDAAPPISTAEIVDRTADSAWVSITATDAASGVAGTWYSLNGSTPALVSGLIKVTGNGKHTIEFWSVDMIGQEETPQFFYVYIDDGVLTINGGDALTMSTDVTITAPVVGVAQMRVNTGAGFGAWRSYVETLPVTLVAPDGIASVTAEYRADTMETVCTLTDTIMLDTLAPVSTATIVEQTPNLARVSITATDAASGVAETWYTLDGGPATKVTGLITVTGNGKHKIYYWSVDLVGRVETQKFIYVYLDNGVLSINGGAAYTTSHDVNISAQVIGVTEMRVDAGAGPGSWVPYASTLPVTLVSNDGVAQVTAEYRDATLETICTLTDTIVLDTAPPVSTAAISKYDPGVTWLLVTAWDGGTGVAESWCTIDGGDPRRVAGLVPVIGAGAHTVAYWSVDVAGNIEGQSSIQVTVNPDEQQTSITSIEGADRFATAVAASRASFLAADTVVIATGRAWPDALGATALAGVLDAPILLVEQNSIPEVVAEDVLRLGARRAIIIGGVSAVGPEVAAALADIDTVAIVERIAGADRYATARLVAARTVAEAGAVYDGTVLIATGGTFADALSISPAAAANYWPVLLVPPNAPIQTETLTFISNEATRAVVLGGTAAVSESAYSQLTGVLGGMAVERISGANRYETSAMVASWSVEYAGLTFWAPGFATGLSPYDALAGGVVQGRSGTVLLLTDKDVLPISVRSLVVARASEMTAVRFYGGLNAVGPAVRAQVEAILGL